MAEQESGDGLADGKAAYFCDGTTSLAFLKAMASRNLGDMNAAIDLRRAKIATISPPKDLPGGLPDSLDLDGSKFLFKTVCDFETCFPQSGPFVTGGKTIPESAVFISKNTDFRWVGSSSGFAIYILKAECEDLWSNFDEWTGLGTTNAMAGGDTVLKGCEIDRFIKAAQKGNVSQIFIMQYGTKYRLSQNGDGGVDFLYGKKSPFKWMHDAARLSAFCCVDVGASILTGGTAIGLTHSEAGQHGKNSPVTVFPIHFLTQATDQYLDWLIKNGDEVTWDEEKCSNLEVSSGTLLFKSSALATASCPHVYLSDVKLDMAHKTAGLHKTLLSSEIEKIKEATVIVVACKGYNNHTAHAAKDVHLNGRPYEQIGHHSGPKEIRNLKRDMETLANDAEKIRRFSRTSVGGLRFETNAMAAAVDDKKIEFKELLNVASGVSIRMADSKVSGVKIGLEIENEVYHELIEASLKNAAQYHGSEFQGLALQAVVGEMGLYERMHYQSREYVQDGRYFKIHRQLCELVSEDALGICDAEDGYDNLASLLYIFSGRALSPFGIRTDVEFLLKELPLENKEASEVRKEYKVQGSNAERFYFTCSSSELVRVYPNPLQEKVYRCRVWVSLPVFCAGTYPRYSYSPLVFFRASLL